MVLEKNRGTSFGCTLFNDIKCYFENKKSPLFSCSLDAEKCFDSIWHKALFHKLTDKIPDAHWLILYRWYNNLMACVKWNGKFSNMFEVTKGTRQGSVLSPKLFNIFIDDLLRELYTMSDNVCIGDYSFNVFAYADDITVVCTSVPGLQRLIDTCTNYAISWRFKFGFEKTKCMVISGKSLSTEPIWYLNNHRLENVNSLEILGVVFEDCPSVSQTGSVDKRTEKCRRSFHSMRDIGMSYPGLASDAKAYIWNTMCQPILLYGMDCIPLSNTGKHKLASTQGNLLKQSLGLNKRSHSSNLLKALNVNSIEAVIKRNTACLLKRIFNVPSPVQQLCCHFMSLYATKGILVPGTLVSRIVQSGLSPIDCVFNKIHKEAIPSECGIVDSLKALIMHEHFIKPYSEEHILASLLIRAF